MVVLRYHGHLAKFGYGKYLTVPFLVRFGSMSGFFSFAMGILARLGHAKIRTMAQPNYHDTRPKRTKKVRLGIIRLFVQIVIIAIAQYHGISTNY